MNRTFCWIFPREFKKKVHRGGIIIVQVWESKNQDFMGQVAVDENPKSEPNHQQEEVDDAISNSK